MITVSQKDSFILFLGDLIFLYLSLWVTLLLRYSQFPDERTLSVHFIPFSILFIIWVLVFFIAGLYEKHALVLKRRLDLIILNTQIINSIIAISFFYFIPYFGIEPKTNLFIYLIVSLICIYFWRTKLVSLIGFKKIQNAILVGGGEDMKTLQKEVNSNLNYGLKFISTVDLDNIDQIDFQKEIIDRVYSEGVRLMIVDLQNKEVKKILPHFYNLIFSKVKFIDLYKVYEDIFDRIPLSLVGYNWFLENISSSSHLANDSLKRIMDILASIILGTISLIFYPFVYVAIKLEDGGDVFIEQERIGQGNKIIKMLKFRSMTGTEDGVWIEEGKAKITKVGKFIRKTRIDEIPQLWNILNGDISLIGPRPDIVGLGKRLSSEIPYYNVRNLVKPGLSGWAQIKQNYPPQSVEETKIRLSYDLYYIKNRSFILDFKIALKTVKTLLSRQGS